MAHVQGADELIKQLERLAKEMPRTIESGLKRLAVEANEDVQRQIGEALEFSGPGTKKFVSGSMKVKYQKAGQIFRAIFYPWGKGGELIARHARPANRVTPEDKADLTTDGLIAVPLPGVRRTARGTVPRNMQPGALLEEDEQGRARAFVAASGKAIMLRRRRDVVPIFALESQTKNPQRIDLPAMVKRAVTNRIRPAFMDAIHRAIKRVAARPKGAK